MVGNVNAGAKRNRDWDHGAAMRGSERFPLGLSPPSRNRGAGANAISGAAQTQLGGKALPSLITGEWYSAGGHVRAAEHVNHTADLINDALPGMGRRVTSLFLGTGLHFRASEDCPRRVFEN